MIKNMKDNFIDVVKNKYSKFDGRASKKEYWMFVFASLLVSIAIGIVDKALDFEVGRYDTGVIGIIYSLALLIPTLAVAVRRLHDTDRSGWWMLILFIPFVGFIVWLVFMLQKSTPIANKYGLNPNEAVKSESNQQSTEAHTPAV